MIEKAWKTDPSQFIYYFPYVAVNILLLTVSSETLTTPTRAEAGQAVGPLIAFYVPITGNLKDGNCEHTARTDYTARSFVVSPAWRMSLLITKP